MASDVVVESAPESIKKELGGAVVCNGWSWAKRPAVRLFAQSRPVNPLTMERAGNVPFLDGALDGSHALERAHLAGQDQHRQKRPHDECSQQEAARGTQQGGVAPGEQEAIVRYEHAAEDAASPSLAA